MLHTTKTTARLLFVCQAGLIAALYTVLTLFVGAFGLANGAVQLRISEALCVLPYFTPAAIPGLTVGCLISNLITSGLWQDVLFGSLATLIGAWGAYFLRKLPWLVPLPTVIANTVIVPFVLVYAYMEEQALPWLMLSVGLGEVVSAYVCGMLLLLALKPYGHKIFRNGRLN